MTKKMESLYTMNPRPINHELILYHHRFGHLSSGYDHLIQLIKDKMLDDFKVDLTNQNLLFCAACRSGKAKHTPAPEIKDRFVCQRTLIKVLHSLTIIHSDTKRYQTKALNGFIGKIIFVDEYSRSWFVKYFTWVRNTKHHQELDYLHGKTTQFPCQSFPFRLGY